MTHRIGKAIAIAAEVHKEQVDKGDEPYMYHVWEVMNRGKERCLALGITDPETITTIMCLCVLHDALEDFEGTPIERGHLRDRISNDCGSQVLARLDILTKRRASLTISTLSEWQRTG